MTLGIFPWYPRQNHVPWGRLSLWKWAPGISPGVKVAGAFGWRTTTLVVPKRQENPGALIYPEPLGPPPVVGDLYCFTFTYLLVLTAIEFSLGGSSPNLPIMIVPTQVAWLQKCIPYRFSSFRTTVAGRWNHSHAQHTLRMNGDLLPLYHTPSRRTPIQLRNYLDNSGTWFSAYTCLGNSIHV